VNGNEISENGKEIIDSINTAFERARNQIEVTEERAKLAEKAVVEVKQTVTEELRSAYQQGLREGYKKGIEAPVANGNPEGGPTLVLNNS